MQIFFITLRRKKCRCLHFSKNKPENVKGKIIFKSSGQWTIVSLKADLLKVQKIGTQFYTSRLKDATYLKCLIFEICLPKIS